MTIARPLVLFASALVVGSVCGAALARPLWQRPSGRLSLDRAFGDRGVAEFSGSGTDGLDQFEFIATDAVAQHIYVAGSSPAPAVVRFDRFGSPDATFGTRGVAVLPVAGRVDGIVALDGVLVHGVFDPPPGSGISTKIGAVKLLADGSGLDPTFGTGGFLSLDPLRIGHIPEGTRAVGRNPVDGSYVASVWWWATAGRATGGLFRFSKDGVIDASFGGDGFIEIDLPDGSDVADNVAVDSAGRTVISLLQGIWRFDADGTRDTTFGTSGVLRDPDGTILRATHLAIAAGDSVVALGEQTNRHGFPLCRWTADGSLDASFGRGGRIDLPYRFRRGSAIPSAMSIVPVAAGGTEARDRVFVAGGSWFLDRRNPSYQHSGWFGELVDGSRSRFMRKRAHPNPGRVESMWLAGVVCIPGRAIAIGNRARAAPNSTPLGPPFLVGFDLDR
jgi:uncharacterized delta-60 repeat protein